MPKRTSGSRSLSLVASSLLDPLGEDRGHIAMSVDLQSESSETMQIETAADDPRILQRIAKGDQTAVKECVEAYGSLIWSIARRYAPTHSDAEDVVQDVFIELWKKAESYNPDLASETTFVAMVCRRKCIDRLRSQRARAAVASVSIEDVDLPDSRTHDALELDDEAAKAMGCIEKLSAEQRKVITLSVHHGISHQGIADHLSMPLGTVKSYARRALLQLRECMKRKALLPPLGEV